MTDQIHEASEKYAKRMCGESPLLNTPVLNAFVPDYMRDAFRAGARWQQQRDAGKMDKLQEELLEHKQIARRAMSTNPKMSNLTELNGVVMTEYEAIEHLKEQVEELKAGRYERGTMWNEMVALKEQLRIAVEALERYGIHRHGPENKCGVCKALRLSSGDAAYTPNDIKPDYTQKGIAGDAGKEGGVGCLK